MIIWTHSIQCYWFFCHCLSLSPLSSISLLYRHSTYWAISCWMFFDCQNGSFFSIPQPYERHWIICASVCLCGLCHNGLESKAIHTDRVRPNEDITRIIVFEFWAANLYFLFFILYSFSHLARFNWVYKTHKYSVWVQRTHKLFKFVVLN